MTSVGATPLTLLDLDHDVLRLIVGHCTHWLFPVPGDKEHGSFLTRGVHLVDNARAHVFFLFQRWFRTVSALRLTNIALYQSKALPTLADLGRLVFRAFQAGLLMPGRLTKLVSASMDPLLHDKDERSMRALGRYVMTHRRPTVNTCSIRPPWAEAQVQCGRADRKRLFGSVFHESPPHVVEMVNYAKKRAERDGTQRMNVPVMALLPKRGQESMQLKEWNWFKLRFDAFMLDELRVHPDTFAPTTPDGRMVRLEHIFAVRSDRKRARPLTSIVKWDRQKVKRWVRNRNALVLRHVRKKKSFARRLRRAHKRYGGGHNNPIVLDDDDVEVDSMDLS